MVRLTFFSTTRLIGLAVILGGFGMCAEAAEPPSTWKAEWPRTDFSKSDIDFGEIVSGGPPKDGIPAIDEPRFVQLDDADLDPKEPVMVFTHAGEARAYPLRILIWHEIVNDRIADRPIVVTYCPLCNTGIVFDRKLAGKVLDFGVSGKLHASDMIMYDRQTESWWQQFTGEAIVGEMVGKTLDMLPSVVWPFEQFSKSYPNGRVLAPADARLRRYGTNPYRHYDTSQCPFLFRGEFDEDISPLAYVVAVGDKAWSLSLLRKKGEITAPPYRLSWRSGMASALDASDITKGRDIGFVEVVDISGEKAKAVPFVTTFAFAFKAFHPKGTLHLDSAS